MYRKNQYYDEQAYFSALKQGQVSGADEIKAEIMLPDYNNYDKPSEIDEYIEQNAAKKIYKLKNGTIKQSGLLNNIYIIAGDSDVNIVLNYDNEIISNETYVLQKGAKLKINTIATPSRLKYINRQFYLQDNAQLNCSIVVSSNGLFEMRNFYNLEGYGSSVSERGAFILHNKETARMFTQLNHIGQNTKGDSHMRGVLFGNASASIEGMAKIFLNAKGTDSYLNQHAMLLSKNAKAYTFPSLEIENNDVKAKHSASVSQIDEEQLFYMMSRGLSRADTIKEIISGFLASTIDIRKVAEFESIISKVTV